MLKSAYMKIPTSSLSPLCLILLITFIAYGCKKDVSNENNNINSNIKTDTSLYTVSGAGGQDSGQILLAFNTNTNGVLAILDEKGNLLKEKITGLRTEDFQKWNIAGETFYTYFQTEGTYTIAGVGVEEGYDIICDSNLNQLSRENLLPYEFVDTSGDDKLDLHDFILLGANHYMAISDRLESPANIPDSLHPSSNARVIACVIQEVNNGQVVFQWDATTFRNFMDQV